MSFPKSVLHYWSSKAHQRGIKCTIDEATFSMNNQLSLVPYDSGLSQRPRANWTISKCLGEVKNILAYVKTKVEVRTAEGEVVDLEVSWYYVCRCICCSDTFEVEVREGISLIDHRLPYPGFTISMVERCSTTLAILFKHRYYFFLM